MNQTQQLPTLGIWQQNLNKSNDAQVDLLNLAKPTEWNVLALQEPYLNKNNKTYSSSHWQVIYPVVHGADHAPRTRSVLMISKTLSTHNWNEVHVPHPDVTAVTIRTEGSITHIFNLYVDAEGDTAIHASARATQKLLELNEDSRIIWLGDFNRHHPAWDSPRNTHLFTPRNLRRAEVLTTYLATYDLDMALPPALPTLEATRTKNYTRPDNVFCSSALLERLQQCTVRPELRVSKTDHFPIQITFAMPMVAAAPRRGRDFQKVDWGEFDAALVARIEARAVPQEISTINEFDTVLDELMQDLHDTIEELVPTKPDTPYTKRWWSKELAKMRTEKERLGRISFRHRGDKDHPAHAEYRHFRNRYTYRVRAAKNDFWKAWIDSVDGKTIWDANRFLQRGPSDYSSERIPPIKVTSATGQPTVLVDNADKGAEFHRTFFLPPSTEPIPSGPYPAPHFRYSPITNRQVRQAIQSLPPFKALGPDAIPNEVYKQCCDTLTPVLGSLLRATFKLGYYPDLWKTSDTVVLKKPGKTDYTTAKSWRPIALLNCMSKILSRCVADVLTHEAERKSLLANLQFGGAGRTTTDSIHLLNKTVKDAWRRGDVASIVFLDIKSAFPAASPERLFHNLRMRGVPREYVDWLRVKLAGRKTRLKFDDFTTELFDILSGIDQGCPLSVILYAFYNSDLIDSARLEEGELAVGSMDDVALIVTGKTFADCHAKIRKFMERHGGGLDWSKAHNSAFSLDKFGLLNCKARTGSVPPSGCPTARQLPPPIITVSSAYSSTSHSIPSNMSPWFTPKEHGWWALSSGSPQRATDSRCLLCAGCTFPLLSRASCTLLTPFSPRSEYFQVTNENMGPSATSRSWQQFNGRWRSSWVAPSAPHPLTRLKRTPGSSLSTSW